MRMLGTVLLATAVTLVANSAGMAASQQLIGNNYESFTDEETCNASFCVISFPAIPAGKTIRVKTATCNIVAKKPPSFIFFGPTATSKNYSFLKKSFFPLSRSNFISPYYYQTFQSNDEIMIGPGRFPTVYYGTESDAVGISMQCVLTGTAL